SRISIPDTRSSLEASRPQLRRALSVPGVRAASDSGRISSESLAATSLERRRRRANRHFEGYPDFPTERLFRHENHSKAARPRREARGGLTSVAAVQRHRQEVPTKRTVHSPFNGDSGMRIDIRCTSTARKEVN